MLVFVATPLSSALPIRHISGRDSRAIRVNDLRSLF